MSVDRYLSRLIAGKIEAQSGACYGNAWNALIWHGGPGNPLEGGRYVEGWAVNAETLLVFQHAWVELDDRIVDPSLADQEGIIYFPGLRLDRLAARQAVIEQGEGLTWQDTGFALPNDPEYQRAYLAAWDYVLSNTDRPVDPDLLTYLDGVRAQVQPASGK